MRKTFSVQSTTYIYPASVLRRELERLQPLIGEGRCIGTAVKHAQGDRISLQHASHVVRSAELVGAEDRNPAIELEIETLSTKEGVRLEHELMHDRVEFGLVGVGTTVGGHMAEVQDDFVLVQFAWMSKWEKDDA